MTGQEQMIASLSSFLPCNFDGLHTAVAHGHFHIGDIDDLIDVCDRAYYNGTGEVVTDELYDFLRAFRTTEAERYGYAPREDQPGAVPSRTLSVEHPPEYRAILGSITRKITSCEQALSYFGDLTYTVDSVRVTPKIDGASALAVIDTTHNLFYAFTRGRNGVGMSITTKFSSYIWGILRALSEAAHGPVGVRLEVYITPDWLEELNEYRVRNGESPYANPRSATSAILGQLEPDDFALRALSYMIIGVYRPSRIENLLLNTEYRRELHFPPNPVVQIIPDIRFTANSFATSLPPDGCHGSEIGRWLHNAFGFLRVGEEFDDHTTFRYMPIDGLVVELYRDRYPVAHTGEIDSASAHMVAYKFPPETRTTRVSHIEYSMGGTGMIIPTAVLDPVLLNGTWQGRVSCSNFDNLVKRGIFPGAIVALSLNLDVMPYISQVMVPGDPLRFALPQLCPFCGHPTVFRDNSTAQLACVNDNCNELKTQRMLRFFTSFSTNAGIGEAVCNALANELNLQPCHLFYTDYRNMAKHLETALYPAQLSRVWSFLHTYLWARPLRDYEIVEALWFHGVGHRKAMQVCNAVSIDLLLRTRDANALPVTDNTVRNIIQRMYSPYNASAMNQLAYIYTVQRAHGRWVSTTGSASATFQIAITGTIPGYTRGQLEHVCASRGIEVASTVNRSVRYLVAGESPGASKINRAHAIGIPIMTGVDFVTHVLLQP